MEVVETPFSHSLFPLSQVRSKGVFLQSIKYLLPVHPGVTTPYCPSSSQGWRLLEEVVAVVLDVTTPGGRKGRKSSKVSWKKFKWTNFSYKGKKLEEEEERQAW